MTETTGARTDLREAILNVLRQQPLDSFSHTAIFLAAAEHENVAEFDTELWALVNEGGVVNPVVRRFRLVRDPKLSDAAQGVYSQTLEVLKHAPRGVTLRAVKNMFQPDTDPHAIEEVLFHLVVHRAVDVIDGAFISRRWVGAPSASEKPTEEGDTP